MPPVSIDASACAARAVSSTVAATSSTRAVRRNCPSALNTKSRMSSAISGFTAAAAAAESSTLGSGAIPLPDGEVDEDAGGPSKEGAGGASAKTAMERSPVSALQLDPPRRLVDQHTLQQSLEVRVVAGLV